MPGGAGSEPAAALTPNGGWAPWRRWLAIVLALSFVALSAYDVVVPGAEVPMIVYIVLGGVIGAVFPTGMATIAATLDSIATVIGRRRRE
ncbi:MAG: hypothetical protein KatS3mg060_1149 [Dehalococcoidia bacterium]|nr:MAG: hypothetical protein KatS3mg060_1149 [Dehalococcoidia bacterium]